MPDSSAEPQKNLQQIEEETLQAFSNFMIILIEPRPHRDRVRVTIDDGIARLTLQRDKFIKMIEDVLDIDDPVIRPNYLRIKQCIYCYSGFYTYDRVNNKFKELIELPDATKISSKDLIKQSQTVVETQKVYNDLVKVNETIRQTKSPFVKEQKSSNKFFAFFRNFSESFKGKQH